MFVLKFNCFNFGAKIQIHINLKSDDLNEKNTFDGKFNCNFFGDFQMVCNKYKRNLEKYLLFVNLFSCKIRNSVFVLLVPSLF